MDNKEKGKLRRADFITSIVLFIFSLIMLIYTFKMPMQDTYAGVQNVWYVSPAVFPLFVCIAIIALSIILFINSIREGGLKFLKEEFKAKSKVLMTDNGYRFAAILLALFTYVYLIIPRIDFYLATLAFLLYFVTIFYLDDMQILKKATWFHFYGHLIFLVIFLTGLDKSLGQFEVFPFFMDTFYLIYLIALALFLYIYSKASQEYQKKFLISLLVAVIVPTILCPVFRFNLLVPLPREGMITELMYIIKYTLFPVG